MSGIIDKVVFFIFVLPTLMFKEGYPVFEKYINEKGGGSPRLWFAVLVLSLLWIVLWGMGASYS